MSSKNYFHLPQSTYFVIAPTDNKKFWKSISDLILVKRDTTKLKNNFRKGFYYNRREKNATLVNNCFINITKNVDLKPSTVSKTNEFDKITKHFDGNISVCK